MGWSTRTDSDHRYRCRVGIVAGVTVGALLGGAAVYGQTNFWQLTDFGLRSRIHSLASSPRGFLFAGTDDRKVVRSSDGGSTWTDVGDEQLSPIIWSLAVDSLGTVFAGTDFRGVFRSTDDGATWLASNLTLQRISCLLLTGQGRAYAGVWDEGIYRSTDGGAVWILVGAPGQKVRAIIETPDGTLVAASDTTGQEGRLYRSTDGGDNWLRVGVGLSSGVVHALESISADTLFAGTAGQGIYRSTNTGDFWSSSYLLLPTTVSALLSVEGQGIFAGLLVGGVLRTTNSGANWSFEETGLLNLEVRSLLHGSDGHLYAGTGEGVYRSTQVLTRIWVDEPPAESPPAMLRAYPNPFNAGMTLSYSVPRAGPVRLSAVDLRGHSMLIRDQNLHPPGSHHVRWIADNLASGVYFIVLETLEGVMARKVLLLK